MACCSHHPSTGSRDIYWLEIIGELKSFPDTKSKYQPSHPATFALRNSLKNVSGGEQWAAQWQWELVGGERSRQIRRGGLRTQDTQPANYFNTIPQTIFQFSNFPSLRRILWLTQTHWQWRGDRNEGDLPDIVICRIHHHHHPHDTLNIVTAVSESGRGKIAECFVVYWSILVSNITRFNICNTKNVLWQLSF